jgi:hypothetical protein
MPCPNEGCTAQRAVDPDGVVRILMAHDEEKRRVRPASGRNVKPL